jgi:hypothetical protein
MGSEITVRVPPLTRDGDYMAWASSIAIRALLITQNRLDQLLDKKPTEDEKEKEKDVLCKAKLQLHVTGPLKAVIERPATAHEAWNALHEEYVGSLRTRQPQLLAALTTLSRGSLTLVQYIDKVKELRDEFEALEMKASLPLLSQNFITGLNDHLQLACGPSLHALVTSDKGIDEITAQLRSMVLMLPPSLAMANSTMSHSPTTPSSSNSTKKKETRTCHYCGKVGHLKAAYRKFKRENGKGMPNQSATVMCTQSEGYVSALSNIDQSAIWFDTMATHHVVQKVSYLMRRRPSAIKAVVL